MLASMARLSFSLGEVLCFCSYPELRPYRWHGRNSGLEYSISFGENHLGRGLFASTNLVFLSRTIFVVTCYPGLAQRLQRRAKPGRRYGAPTAQKALRFILLCTRADALIGSTLDSAFAKFKSKFGFGIASRRLGSLTRGLCCLLDGDGQYTIFHVCLHASRDSRTG
jgi:hypothetical protein